MLHDCSRDVACVFFLLVYVLVSVLVLVPFVRE